jgi:hypothetical protein
MEENNSLPTKVLKEALEIINKQERELQQLYLKLEERSKESKERYFIDIIINSGNQIFSNNCKKNLKKKKR